MSRPDLISPARRHVRLDPRHAPSPRSRPEADRHPVVTHRHALLVTGLIAERHSPAPPAVVAIGAASDALVRAIATDRRRSGPAQPDPADRRDAITTTQPKDR